MNDPVVLLKNQHREADALLKELAASKPGTRRRTQVSKLDKALTLHMQIEEELVLSASRQDGRR